MHGIQDSLEILAEFFISPPQLSPGNAGDIGTFVPQKESVLDGEFLYSTFAGREIEPQDPLAEFYSPNPYRGPGIALQPSDAKVLDNQTITETTQAHPGTQFPDHGMIVKPADFGFATTDYCAYDFGCGSTFYMPPGKIYAFSF